MRSQNLRESESLIRIRWIALVKEIQRTLIQSDVDVKLVFDLSKRIKDEALDEKIPKGLTRREHIINIVHSELTRFWAKKRRK